MISNKKSPITISISKVVFRQILEHFKKYSSDDYDVGDVIDIQVNDKIELRYLITENPTHIKEIQNNDIPK